MVGSPQGDVVANAAVKQHHILRQHAHAATQFHAGNLPDVHVAELHRPFLGLVKSGKKVSSMKVIRSFPTARAAVPRFPAMRWLRVIKMSKNVPPLQNSKWWARTLISWPGPRHRGPFPPTWLSA